MNEREIQNHDDIAEGVDWLCEVEPEFEKAAQLCPNIPLRLRPQGFDELLRAINAQQLSVAAANAIWTRVAQAGLTTPNAIIAADDSTLRACGFSKQKIIYARDLATADIDFAALPTLSSDEVISRLVSVRGIGPWTAEIYAMFSLGRADVFAPGDLALQEAARVLFGLKNRPTEGKFRKMAADWSPWRAVAARLLWDYYRVLKDRDGI